VPPKKDPRITKRKVTMRSVFLAADGKTYEQRAEDYVLPEIMDAYLAMMRRVWQSVVVSHEPDAGPGGYEGATHIPHGVTRRSDDGREEFIPLEHRLAGLFRPAIGEHWHPEDPANPANDGVAPNNPVATARHLGVPVEELDEHPAVQRAAARRKG
jgi:hypothetical protein